VKMRRKGVHYQMAKSWCTNSQERPGAGEGVATVDSRWVGSKMGATGGRCDCKEMF